MNTLTNTESLTFGRRITFAKVEGAKQKLRSIDNFSLGLIMIYLCINP